MSGLRLVDRKSSDAAVIDSPLGERKKNRRGKGSRSKQAENFRSKKNVEFDDEITARLDNLKLSFGYAPRDLFGDRLLTVVLRPQIQIPVNTRVIGTLCHEIAEVLHHACKIPGSQTASEFEIIEHDVDTLRWVTALQLESKLVAARCGTQFPPPTDTDLLHRVQRTNLLFKRALIPLSVVIDQIGRFSIAEQTFVPNINGTEDYFYYCLYDPNNVARLDFPCLQSSNEDCAAGVLVTRNHLGQKIRAVTEPQHFEELVQRGIMTSDGSFSLAFLSAPHQFNYLGMVDFVAVSATPTPPSIDQIASRYAELEGRISKKLNNVFVELELTKGMGVESQIAFRRSLDAGTYAVWSPRPIRADSLEIGGILGLGFDSDGFGKYEHAAVLTTVETSGGLECLANVLTKRIR